MMSSACMDLRAFGSEATEAWLPGPARSGLRHASHVRGRRAHPRVEARSVAFLQTP